MLDLSSWWRGLTDEAQAAWAQAFLSVLAIVTSALLVFFGHWLAEPKTRQERHEQAVGIATSIYAILYDLCLQLVQLRNADPELTARVYLKDTEMARSHLLPQEIERLKHYSDTAYVLGVPTATPVLTAIQWALFYARPAQDVVLSLNKGADETSISRQLRSLYETAKRTNEACDEAMRALQPLVPHLLGKK